MLLAICSWISIPTAVPFTLQTFGIFLTLFLLGGKTGTIAILIYLLLGAIGIPVFSNFGAGLGYLFGSTGGYALGFLMMGLTFWLFEKWFGKKIFVQIISLLAGLVLCYSFGTLWFLHISMNSGGTYELMTVLALCVFPFLLPDFCKLWIAYMISKRLKHMLY